MRDTHQLGPLLDRSRAGDPAALDALLARLRPYLRLLARTRLGPGLGSRLDESDVVQEALLRVYRGFGQFNGRSVPELLGWVGQIVAHAAATCARGQGADKRDPAREAPGGERLARFLPAKESDPPAQRDEDAARLAAALERLSDAQRQVIEARFFEQLSFQEIGRRTGKSEGAVRVVCVRGLERLRRELAEEP
jgi:RNA polymerase sigma-70 factor (ECF subfamily)